MFAIEGTVVDLLERGFTLDSGHGATTTIPRDADGGEEARPAPRRSRAGPGGPGGAGVFLQLSAWTVGSECARLIAMNTRSARGCGGFDRSRHQCSSAISKKSAWRCGARLETEAPRPSGLDRVRAHRRRLSPCARTRVTMRSRRQPVRPPPRSRGGRGQLRNNGRREGHVRLRARRFEVTARAPKRCYAPMCTTTTTRRSVRFTNDLAPYLAAPNSCTGYAHAPQARRSRGSRVRLGIFDGSHPVLDKAVVARRPRGVRAMPLCRRARGRNGPRRTRSGTRLRPSSILTIRTGAHGSADRARSWPARRKLLGATQRKAARRRDREIPEGFDWSYYQAAPPDQRRLPARRRVDRDGWCTRRCRACRCASRARTRARADHGLGALGVREGRALELCIDTLRIDGDEQRARWCPRQLPGARARPRCLVRIVAGVETAGESIAWPEPPARGASAPRAPLAGIAATATIAAPGTAFLVPGGEAAPRAATPFRAGDAAPAIAQSSGPKAPREGERYDCGDPHDASIAVLIGEPVAVRGDRGGEGRARGASFEGAFTVPTLFVAFADGEAGPPARGEGLIRRRHLCALGRRRRGSRAARAGAVRGRHGAFALERAGAAGRAARRSPGIAWRRSRRRRRPRSSAAI